MKWPRINIDVAGTIVVLLLCRFVAGASIDVQIDDGHAISTFDAGFASVTLDFHPVSQGVVWGKNASILEIDLESKALRGVASALSPAVLRLGGSEAGSNVTYVDFPGYSNPCPTGTGVYYPNRLYYYCLTRERWDKVLDFASSTGLRLMLDLNIVGPAQSDDWTKGLAQIDGLLAYTAGAGHTPWAFELGNENQNNIAPEIAAERVVQVHERIALHWPDPTNRPMLVGPSVHIFPDWITDFLRALPRNGSTPPLDIFAYHMYSGYGKAPHIASQVATTSFLDDARSLVDTAAASVRFSNAGSMSSLPILVSETAAAWASGGPTGACISFASSFWYFDHLAHAASSIGGGHVAVARQTLVGGNYSLVDSNNGYFANPDYFVALLWREVVEGGDRSSHFPIDDASSVRVLRATRAPVIGTDTHRELRSFAACDPSGRLVVGVANMADVAAPVAVKLTSGTNLTSVGRDEWVLEADEASLLTRKVKLNGKPITSTGGVIPPLPPRRSTDAFTAPPKSIAFLRFDGIKVGACT